MTRTRVALLACALVLAGCASSGQEGDRGPIDRLGERLTVVQAHVEEWRTAGTLTDARRAAEAAANHIVGPTGPGFGDRDGDGTVRGPGDAGVLPGSEGWPLGFAVEAARDGAPECVVRDVLGGSWEDAPARWNALAVAIDTWTEERNTFPSLPSHAQRVVGWAALALEADTLQEARDHAGHAALHAGISLRAVTDC